MPKKLCNYNGCNAVIGYKEQYCDKHKKKQMEHNKQRYKLYDAKVRDPKLKAFYSSKAWKSTSLAIKKRDRGLCKLCLYKNMKGDAETTHHIVEIKEDFEQRLSEKNLISLCDKCHKQVHAEYEKGQKSKENQQKELYLALNYLR